MKSNIKGFLILSNYVDKCLNEIYKSKGIALKKILYDWHAIVGDSLSSYTLPYKVTVDKREQKTKRVLHIFVANSCFSSELFHMSNIIVEKIQFYTGDDYIDQLRFDLNPSLRIDTFLEEDQIPINQPKIDIEGIEDACLEDSLTKLGQSIRFVSEIKNKAI